jgi:hypothetical protein
VIPAQPPSCCCLQMLELQAPVDSPCSWQGQCFARACVQPMVFALTPARCPPRRATGDTDPFSPDDTWWGDNEFIALSDLNNKAAGWIVKDTLVLTVEVTVTREDWFQVDTGASIGRFVSGTPSAQVCVSCTPQVACRAT